jgi:hypothetical protein
VIADVRQRIDHLGLDDDEREDALSHADEPF